MKTLYMAMNCDTESLLGIISSVSNRHCQVDFKFNEELSRTEKELSRTEKELSRTEKELS